MSDKRQQKIGAFAESPQFAGKPAAELMATVRSGIGHASVFRVRPDLFVGVEFRSIAWKFLRHDFRMLCKILLNRLRFVVDMTPVPDDGQRSWDISMQMPQEADYVAGMGVFIIRQQYEVKTTPFSFRADRDGADGRYPVAPVPASEGGSLSPGRKRPPNRGPQHKARFVLEDEGRAPLFGVFFMRGNSSLFHLLISASSRSRARRSGFWLVHPSRLFNMTRTCSGLYRMPNVRRITTATRLTVHRSSIQPLNLAPFFSVCSSFRSWVGFIRRRRPGLGIARSPSGPCFDISRHSNRELLLQPIRRTTSHGRSPFSKSSTALRRLRSSSSALPFGLISPFTHSLPLNSNTYISPV